LDRAEALAPWPRTQRQLSWKAGSVPAQEAAMADQPAGRPSLPTRAASTAKLVAVATADTPP
jgi:hypothetical protein